MELGTIRWTDRLPPEVWQIVLGFATFGTTRQCLAVSRLFHDLAARRLFSWLLIQFGSWEVVRHRFASASAEGDTSSLSGCKSYDVLIRVINDPVFASYVKHVGIAAYAKEITNSEMCKLTQAVGAMHNLRSFGWYTSSHTFMLPSNELLETLTSTCGRLREYSLPIQSLDALHVTKRMQVTNISLDIDIPYVFGSGREQYDAHRKSFVSLLETYRGSLAELSMPNLGMRDCPTYSLQDLTHLAITYIDEHDDIAVVFRYCTRLESLDLNYIPVLALSAAVTESPSALPHLTHLKLCFSSSPIGRGASQPIADFIRSKKKLRCLDYADEAMSIMAQSPVMSAIKSLATLEVLGLNFWKEFLEAEEFTLLRHTIPSTITALRLCLDYEVLDEDCQWIDMWAGLPGLVFAYVDDCEHGPIVKTIDLATAAKSLELVGHRSKFHEIYRTDDRVTLSEPWSPTQVEFRIAADFGCDDWEWLLRGHVTKDY